jgi:hypothetical protein
MTLHYCMENCWRLGGPAALVLPEESSGEWMPRRHRVKVGAGFLEER